MIFPVENPSNIKYPKQLGFLCVKVHIRGMRYSKISSHSCFMKKNKGRASTYGPPTIEPYWKVFRGIVMKIEKP